VGEQILSCLLSPDDGREIAAVIGFAPGVFVGVELVWGGASGGVDAG